jgi:hypothetical protein
MATSATPAANTPDDKAQPTLLRRARRHVPQWAWFTMAAFAFVLLVIGVQLALYLQRSDPRDTRAIVERELRTNTLRAGEPVVREVRVFRRSLVDYFRATRGSVVLTPNRLVYLGAPPRDISGASGAAPTFDQREFPIDTLVQVRGSFSLLGMSRALVIDAPEGDFKVAVSKGGRSDAIALREAWEGRQKQLREIGVWAGKVRVARAELGKILDTYRKQPIYHEVRAGDAISSIAAWYEVTEDQIRQQNGIAGNTVKVGQRLLIRPGATK